MCGRFTIRRNYDLIQDALGPLTPLPGLPQLPLFNIAPTQTIPVVRLTKDGTGRELAPCHWGLVPFWSKDMSGSAKMINARCETAAERPAFRAALKGRRCLIPADGFYEWQRGEGKAKQPYLIHLRDDRLFAFAGLWEQWRDDAGHSMDSCTILTTGPNDVTAPVHDRMPVILDPGDYAAWLDPLTSPKAVAAMMRPHPPGPMEAYPVSTAVNSPRNQGPELVTPLA